MILTTRLAPSVAHVAQLAVDPEARRRNIARGLLAAASTAAFSLGCSAVTLLVAGDNRPALDLYFGRGFRPVATMLYGFAKGKGVR
jgi:ribosomal protein S18 acetylase RimI-like enzyme